MAKYKRSAHFQRHLKIRGISKETCSKVKPLFLLTDAAFRRLSDRDMRRVSFLQYDFVLHQLLRLVGHSEQATPVTLSKPKLDQHQAIWDDVCKEEPLLDARYAAACKIQRCARRWLGRRTRAAIRIQRGCQRWIWTPVLKDGSYGICLRLLLRDLDKDNQELESTHQSENVASRSAQV